MSKMRHHMEHMKAGGGPVVYEGKGSNVEHEAEEKKEGGKVGHKRKFKDGGHIEGMASKKRMDRPGRKTGGRVGADKMPLTEAARIKPADGHGDTMSGDADED